MVCTFCSVWSWSTLVSKANTITTSTLKIYTQTVPTFHIKIASLTLLITSLKYYTNHTIYAFYIPFNTITFTYLFVAVTLPILYIHLISFNNKIFTEIKYNLQSFINIINYDLYKVIHKINKMKTHWCIQHDTTGHEISLYSRDIFCYTSVMSNVSISSFLHFWFNIWVNPDQLFTAFNANLSICCNPIQY